MTKYLFLDFETSSDANLKKIGAFNYVNHPTTQVVCAAFWLTEDPTQPFVVGITWHRMPDIEDINLIVVAHNAEFEQLVINRFFPDLNKKIVKWIDTMALASINNVRRGLNQCAADIGIRQQKYTTGAFVMRKINNGHTFNSLTQLEKDELATYCMVDVELTIQIYKRLISTFTKQEHKVWEFTNRHNFKGVDIDMELATKAATWIQEWHDELPKMVKDLTNGEVTAINQVAKLGTYLNMDKVQAPLLIERLKTETNPTFIKLIKLRLEGGKKSVSKFETAVNLTREGKLYGTMDYHAAATGRFASRGVQLQNLIKADREEADKIINNIKNSRKPPFECLPSILSRAVRGLIIPPTGCDLIKADYAQIEARILAWLVDDSELLNKFASGGKIYEDMAASIFNVPLEQVTQEQRFYGKSAVLGCGYGMGAKKFELTYGVSEELATRSVNAYRRKNYRIPQLWRDLENAIVKTVTQGEIIKIGKVITWRDNWRLFIKLPSGRNLVYPYPRYNGEENKLYHKTRKSGQFVEVTYWGGTFVENICQAISRDLLVSAFLALESNPTFEFMFTVHDEIVCSAASLLYDVTELEKCILDSQPEWSKGLPLAVDIEIGDRYFK